MPLKLADRYRSAVWRLCGWGWHRLQPLLRDGQVQGIDVVDVLDEAAAPARSARLHEALALIERHEPRRLRRIQRDVSAIVISPTGPYWEDTRRVCVLPDISAYSSIYLAGVIVHEATHARLSGCGIPYCDPLRERLEHVCIGQELAFLALVPGSGHEFAWAQKSLDRPLPTTEQIAKRELALLEHSPWLRWLMPILMLRAAPRRGKTLSDVAPPPDPR
jgi:hypothetical protein